MIVMTRIPTRPTLAQRLVRNTAFQVALVFLALFAFLTLAELLCMLVGAPFDPRLG